MTKKILVFTGLPACGKGTATKYLAEKYDAKTFRFSTIMRDLLDRLYLPQSRENMSLLSRIVRENFAEDIFAKVMAEDAKQAETDIVVIDGARRLADVEHLSKIKGFLLIAIEGDMKIRYQRLVKRGENPDDQSKTWEEFVADHQLETELSIPELMEKADVVVDNNGSLEEFYKQLDKLV
ncbi:MAG: AAA family ATPase [Patescibacteria group bacterium]|nr:AAA family ATPase [Patescibacteria group bacterium]